MKKVVFLFALLTSFLSLCSCTSDIKNLQKQKIQNYYTCEYKGRARNFYLYLPQSQDLNNTPLIVMLHGYGGAAQSFLRQTEMEKSALPRNYAVLYISGAPIPNVKTSSSGWNYLYDSNGKKDINFIVDLTKYVQKNYKISKNSYVVGFSNGAFMATKLAVEYPKVYKAIVSVGGMMPDMVWKHRKNNTSHGVRFFQINGMKDDVTPMRLNDSAKYNPNPAMEDVIDYFVQINKADSQPQLEVINELAAINKYQNKVWWLLIKDYPHSWPSQRFCKFNVNDYILDFFDGIQ